MEIVDIPMEGEAPKHTVKSAFRIGSYITETQVDVMYGDWYVVRFRKIDGKWCLMRHTSLNHKDFSTNERKQIQLVKGG